MFACFKFFVPAERFVETWSTFRKISTRPRAYGPCSSRWRWVENLEAL